MAAIAPPVPFPISPVPTVSAAPIARPDAPDSDVVRPRVRRLVVFTGKLP